MRPPGDGLRLWRVALADAATEVMSTQAATFHCHATPPTALSSLVCGVVQPPESGEILVAETWCSHLVTYDLDLFCGPLFEPSGQGWIDHAIAVLALGDLSKAFNERNSIELSVSPATLAATTVSADQSNANIAVVTATVSSTFNINKFGASNG